MPTRRRISREVLLLDAQATDGDRSGCGDRMPFSVEDERRLAGAVGTEHGHPFAPLDGEVDAAQRLATVRVGVGDVAELEGRAVIGCSRRSAATVAAMAGQSRHSTHARAVAAALRTGIVPT